MAQYPESYLLSKDIDWFFKINNQYIHVASAGGRLPAIINDREKLRQIQYQVYNSPYIFSAEDIRINQDFIRQLLSPQLNDDPQLYDTYVESFINFDRKGFISCDRTDIKNDTSDTYHVVCVPPSFDRGLQIENIPIITNPNCQLDINSTDIKFLEIVK
ncbi:hypothetical protein [uncultured Rikenella sp.]|uniref:hypothetical protein n=1 Tax=uncultured Rikenella sp. TaxID=368003 RepID=UPI0025FCE36F|nr:hypothetical protein [uncultured Rikenella sp.]